MGALARTVGALGLVGLMASGSAAAEPAVTGTWLAIDDVHPRLWADGLVVAAEEILIAGPSGRVENRLVYFQSIDPEFCRDRNVCSDAPVVRAGRAVLQDGRLRFESLEIVAPVLDAAEVTPILRRTVVTSIADWRAAVSADGRRLVLTSGAVERVFVQVDPTTLRRWRAGFKALELTALTHWRCFLGNVTAGDAAFASLPRDGARPPAWIGLYLKGASWFETFSTMVRMAVADDDDPERRVLARLPIETFAIEPFRELARPADARAAARLADAFRTAKHHELRFTTEEALRVVAAPAGSVLPGLSIGDRELAAVTLGARGQDIVRLACP